MNAKAIVLLIASAAPFSLMCACKSGKESAQQDLQERGYDLTPEAYFRAAESDDTATLETLIAHGMAVETRNEAGDTALHAAAAAGMKRSANYLLDRKLPVDVPGADGRTPLMAAIVNGRVELVRYLLSQKADPKKKDAAGLSPLMLAVREGRGDMVREIAPLDHAKLDDALMVAAIEGKASVIDALTQYGASVYARMDDGRTPLMLAAENGHLEAVDMLLIAGANRFSMDDDGRVAADLARESGHEALALRLAEAPSDSEYGLEEPLDLGAEMLAKVVEQQQSGDPMIPARGVSSPEGQGGERSSPLESPPLLEGMVIASSSPAPRSSGDTDAGDGSPVAGTPASAPPAAGTSAPLVMRAYRQKELPLRVESVGGGTAMVRLAGGGVKEVPTGGMLPGSPLKVVRVQRRMQEMKDDAALTEVSVVEVQDVHSGRSREIISGVDATAQDPVALVEDAAGRHFVARAGQAFRGSDGAEYQVLDVRPNQMVIENRTQGEVITIPLRGPRG